MDASNFSCYLVEVDNEALWKRNGEEAMKYASWIFLPSFRWLMNLRCRIGWHEVVWFDGRPMNCMFCKKKYHPLAYKKFKDEMGKL